MNQYVLTHIVVAYTMTRSETAESVMKRSRRTATMQNDQTPTTKLNNRIGVEAEQRTHAVKWGQGMVRCPIKHIRCDIGAQDPLSFLTDAVRRRA